MWIYLASRGGGNINNVPINLLSNWKALLSFYSSASSSHTSWEHVQEKDLLNSLMIDLVEFSCARLLFCFARRCTLYANTLPRNILKQICRRRQYFMSVCPSIFFLLALFEFFIRAKKGTGPAISSFDLYWKWTGPEGADATWCLLPVLPAIEISRQTAFDMHVCSYVSRARDGINDKGLCHL